MSNILVEYNNAYKAYLAIKEFDGAKYKEIAIIKFPDISLANGLPSYDALLDKLNQFLNSKEIERGNALVLINCREQFKITSVIPDINEKKNIKLYEQEFDGKVKNIDDYYRETKVSSGNNQKIYYDFLLNKTYLNYFNKLMNELGFNSVSVKTYNEHLQTVANKKLGNTYAYYYEEHDVVTLMVVINNILCSCYTFEAGINNYKLSLHSVIEKHISDLEKIKHIDIYSNVDNEFIKLVNGSIADYIIGE